MNKAALRKPFLSQRRALPADEVDRLNSLIIKLFFDFFEQTDLPGKPAVIHTFLPISHQNEVNTWPIIQGLWSSFTHSSVAVPVTNAEAHTLSHYLLSPATRLAENRWGIPEPVSPDSQALSPDVFSIVLVPLLAFDRQGHRVGYGGGFYDRFLADCKPDCLKVGLSLVDPIERIDDVEPTDVRLDACITPSEVIYFSG